MINNILSNLWVIGIGTTMIAGLILYYFFGIGRTKKQITPSKRIGILNEGKNNRFLNNTFIGMDIGIKDKGKNSKTEGNKFK